MRSTHHNIPSLNFERNSPPWGSEAEYCFFQTEGRFPQSQQEAGEQADERETGARRYAAERQDGWTLQKKVRTGTFLQSGYALLLSQHLSLHKQIPFGSSSLCCLFTGYCSSPFSTGVPSSLFRILLLFGWFGTFSRPIFVVTLLFSLRSK